MTMIVQRRGKQMDLGQRFAIEIKLVLTQTGLF